MSLCVSVIAGHSRVAGSLCCTDSAVLMRRQSCIEISVSMMCRYQLATAEFLLLGGETVGQPQ